MHVFSVQIYVDGDDYFLRNDGGGFKVFCDDGFHFSMYQHCLEIKNFCLSIIFKTDFRLRNGFLILLGRYLDI